MAEGSEIFVLKALESLSSAQSEFSNRRFNSSVNRSYYACFHAAAAALIQEGVNPRSPSGQLRHEAVHGQFVGELVNRRHRFPPELRTTLAMKHGVASNCRLRRCDGQPNPSGTGAPPFRGVCGCHYIVEGKGTVMSIERNRNDPNIDRAVNELEQLVRGGFPDAQFQVSEGEDPDGIYLRATVDVPDTDEVLNLVIDRLVELQVDEHLPLYFVALRPRERVIADLKGHPLLSSRRRRVLHVSGNLAP